MSNVLFVAPLPVHIGFSPSRTANDQYEHDEYTYSSNLSSGDSIVDGIERTEDKGPRYKQPQVRYPPPSSSSFGCNLFFRITTTTTESLTHIFQFHNFRYFLHGFTEGLGYLGSKNIGCRALWNTRSEIRNPVGTLPKALNAIHHVRDIAPCTHFVHILLHLYIT